MIFSDCNTSDDSGAYSVQRLIDHINAYLTANPYAADTMAGIQKWWLSGVQHGVDDGVLETAIQIMLRRGILQCQTLPDGTRIYAGLSLGPARTQKPYKDPR